jgi:predicted nucleotidyltransferase
MRTRPEFDSTIIAAIDRHLRLVQTAHHASVLLAIESGSRAWGFPSPDSDYDCRFLFVRPPQGYLSLFTPRDVIEFAPDGVLDVNGWDLGKALRLLLKGNAVVIEWLTSPFVYGGDPAFLEEALALAREVARPQAIARHYLHLGERQRRTYFADARSVPLKKLFYALRPALALRWLRLHPAGVIAPMHFPTLAAETDLPADLAAIVDELLERKAATRELGTGPLPAAIGAIIDTEFSLARELWPDRPGRPDVHSREAAEALFRRWVERVAG